MQLLTKKLLKEFKISFASVTVDPSSRIIFGVINFIGLVEIICLIPFQILFISLQHFAKKSLKYISCLRREAFVFCFYSIYTGIDEILILFLRILSKFYFSL